MAKPKQEYVHVIDKKTRKSIEAIGPSADAERVARGVSINLNHEDYELAISPKKTWP
jgi:hypothetical protein